MCGARTRRRWVQLICRILFLCFTHPPEPVTKGDKTTAGQQRPANSGQGVNVMMAAGQAIDRGYKVRCDAFFPSFRAVGGLLEDFFSAFPASPDGGARGGGGIVVMLPMPSRVTSVAPSSAGIYAENVRRRHTLCTRGVYIFLLAFPTLRPLSMLSSIGRHRFFALSGGGRQRARFLVGRDVQQ